MAPPDDRHRPRKPRPLDAGKLEQLAVRYVGRYATTRAKLRTYLLRKVKERGWQDQDPPQLESLIGRFVALGYVDDAAFAAAKTASLQRRGYGDRRIGHALAAAGIDPADRLPGDEKAAFSAALRFAERKKLGPFAAVKPDHAAREKAFAAMLRAGHSIDLTRTILNAEPGEVPDEG